MTCNFSFFSAFAPTINWLIVIRFLVGVGLGCMPQVITYFVEFMPKTTRCNPVALTQLFFASGQIFTLVLSIWVYPTYGWRQWIFWGGVPSLLTVAFCLWLPESPQFDNIHGNHHKAHKTLEYIARFNGTHLPKGSLQIPNETPLCKEGGCFELSKPENIRITSFTSVLFFSISFLFYGSLIFTPTVIRQITEDDVISEAVHYIEDAIIPVKCTAYKLEDYLHTMYTVLAIVPLSAIMFATINTIHKQYSLVIAFVILGISCFAITIVENLNLVTALLLVIRVAGNTIYIILFVFTADTFPTHIRALGLGISDAVGRFATILTPLVSQLLMDTQLDTALIMYSLVAVFTSFFTFIFYPKSEKNMKKCHTDT